jgi:hypothetical protein
MSLSSEALVVDRRQISHLGLITLCIDKPLYLGCVKLDLDDVLVQSGNDAWFVNLQELGADGSPVGPVKQVPLSYQLTANNDYKIVYTLYFNPINGNRDFFSLYTSICEYTECKFLMSFENAQLTTPGGFSLCQVPNLSCDLVCGKLDICGTQPVFDVKNNNVGQLLPVTVGSDYNSVGADIFSVPILGFNEVLIEPSAGHLLDGTNVSTYPFQIVTEEVDFTDTLNIVTPVQITPVGNSLTADTSGLPVGVYSFEITVVELDTFGNPCPNSIVIPFTLEVQ